MSIVCQIGELVYPDKNGYLTNSIEISQPIQKEWQQPVRLCVQEIKKHLPNLIHSIYLRGSVAKCVAIAGISDIDLVIITKNKIDHKYSKEWIKPFEMKLSSKYPQVNSVEFMIVSLPALLDTSQPIGLQVLLKLQSRLLEGNDVLSLLPPIKPNSGCFINIPIFSKLQTNLKNTPSGKKNNTSWVAKRYIRTGFELCIEREKVFTRDLYPCYEIFSKYYPQYKHQMYKLLEQAIEPTWSKSELLYCINSLGEWTNQEIRKQYPRYSK